MLQDVIDLRNNSWEARQKCCATVTKEDGQACEENAASGEAPGAPPAAADEKGPDGTTGGTEEAAAASRKAAKNAARRRARKAAAARRRAEEGTGAGDKSGAGRTLPGQVAAAEPEAERATATAERGEASMPGGRQQEAAAERKARRRAARRKAKKAAAAQQGPQETAADEQSAVTGALSREESVKAVRAEGEAAAEPMAEDLVAARDETAAAQQAEAPRRRRGVRRRRAKSAATGERADGGDKADASLTKADWDEAVPALKAEAPRRRGRARRRRAKNPEGANDEAALGRGENDEQPARSTPAGESEPMSAEDAAAAAAEGVAWNPATLMRRARKRSARRRAKNAAATGQIANEEGPAGPMVCVPGGRAPPSKKQPEEEAGAAPRGAEKRGDFQRAEKALSVSEQAKGEPAREQAAEGGAFMGSVSAEDEAVAKTRAEAEPPAQRRARKRAPRRRARKAAVAAEKAEQHALLHREADGEVVLESEKPRWRLHANGTSGLAAAEELQGHGTDARGGNVWPEMAARQDTTLTAGNGNAEGVASLGDRPRTQEHPFQGLRGQPSRIGTGISGAMLNGEEAMLLSFRNLVSKEPVMISAFAGNLH